MRLRNAHLLTDLQELRALLERTDATRAFAFSGAAFVPETRRFSTFERAWESFAEVDFITDRAGERQEAHPWVLKSPVQRSHRVFASFAQLVARLRLLKGKLRDSFVVQRYVTDPLLLGGRKVDFKVQVVLASSAPLIAFLKRGYVRQHGAPYDDGELLPSAHLCVDRHARTDENCRAMLFADFREQLLAEGRYSAQRLSQIPERFGAALTYALLAAKTALALRPKQTCLFEGTFVVDADLNVHLVNFAELNLETDPAAQAKPLKRYFQELLEDWLDLALALHEAGYAWDRKFRELCRDCRTLFNERLDFENMHFLRTYDDTQFHVRRKRQTAKSEHKGSIGAEA